MNTLKMISKKMAEAEIIFAGLMLTIVFILLLINVVTRAIGQAQFWVDELAIFAMVWMCFLSASASLYYKTNIAVTIIKDLFGEHVQLLFDLVVDVILFSFCIFFLYLVFRWFNPLGIFQFELNIHEFSLATFNFIYEEPTQTLAIKKFWFWSILPLFTLTTCFHSFTNVCQSINVLTKREEGGHALVEKS